MQNKHKYLVHVNPFDKAVKFKFEVKSTTKDSWNKTLKFLKEHGG